MKNGLFIINPEFAYIEPLLSKVGVDLWENKTFLSNLLPGHITGLGLYLEEYIRNNNNPTKLKQFENWSKWKLNIDID